MTTMQLQNLLAYLGYYTIQVDGIPGKGTTQAVRDFQQAEGLAVDGIAGGKTWAALKDAVAADKFRQTDAQSAPTQTTGTFWDGIRYFDREEFRCKCGGKYCDGYPAEPSEALVTTADKLREHFGKPVTVSSGVRCTKWNAIRGGVSNSRHLSGKAMDFSVSGVSRAEVEAYLGKLKTAGEIRYWYHIGNGWYHMDVE